MSITPFDPAKPDPPFENHPVGMYQRETHQTYNYLGLSPAIENLLALYGYVRYVRGGTKSFVARPSDAIGFQIHPTDTVETVLAAIKAHP